MASRTIVELVDDIDGSEAVETISFALDGVTYDIDLSQEHAQELRADMQRWTQAGRRTNGAFRRISGKKKTPRDHSQVAEIRRWARENGFVIKDQGRIPKDVEIAFVAAHAR